MSYEDRSTPELEEFADWLADRIGQNPDTDGDTIDEYHDVYAELERREATDHKGDK